MTEPNISRARHAGRLLSAVAGAGVRRLWRRSDEDDRRFGEALLAELDTMKGMAMKIGQILSYLDGLPAETQNVLAKLQQGGSPRPYSVMVQVIEASLHAPLHRLFDAFEPVPIAAASIGQVHRARFQGQEVAVKVRYPGIENTFKSDTTQLARIASIAGLASNVDGGAIVKELAARLEEECDYENEASNQNAFRSAFCDDAEIIIPTVFKERSSREVLASSWHDATQFNDFCTQGSEQARQRAAQALVRFAWHSLFHQRMINADPHPGNYLFSDEHVVFLDFGCVRHFDQSFINTLRTLYVCVLDNNRGAFPNALQETGMVPVPAKYDFDEHWKQIRYELEPYMESEFHFTREYTARAAQFSRPTNPNLRRMAIPPPWIWIMRLQYGLHSILRRLDAKGDFSHILRSALALHSD